MIRLAKPDISENLEIKIAALIRSGNLVQGKTVKALEGALADFLNAKNAIVVSSGTAALHLSLMALDIGPGDEVIVPAFTFPSTANVVEIVGAESVLVDITLDDFCIDSSKIESVITNKTRAILPVHEFGQTADLNAILDISLKYGLHVIEDAACAFGVAYQDRKLGSFGPLGCFSFHPRKSMTTAEGGLIITEEDALAEELRSLRNNGLFPKKEGGFDVHHVGLNYRMTEIQALLGLSQLESFDPYFKVREEMASLYEEKLKEISQVRSPKRIEGRETSFQTYHILLDDAVNRDALILALKEDGIETNIGAYALNELSYYKTRSDCVEGDFPNATKAYRQGLALPMGGHLNREAISYIAEKISERLTLKGGNGESKSI